MGHSMHLDVHVHSYTPDTCIIASANHVALILADRHAAYGASMSRNDGRHLLAGFCINEANLFVVGPDCDETTSVGVHDALLVSPTSKISAIRHYNWGGFLCLSCVMTSRTRQERRARCTLHSTRSFPP